VHAQTVRLISLAGLVGTLLRAAPSDGSVLGGLWQVLKEALSRRQPVLLDGHANVYFGGSCLPEILYIRPRPRRNVRHDHDVGGMVVQLRVTGKQGL